MFAEYFSYEAIAILMFATMVLMLLTGQRVFGAIGFVAAAAALLIWGNGLRDAIQASGNYLSGTHAYSPIYLYGLYDF